MRQFSYARDPQPERTMWRTFASVKFDLKFSYIDKRFTNQYPTFHEYVVKLKQEKQLEFKRAIQNRIKEKREEEKKKDIEIQYEIEREK
jgi:hypothetical protein